MNTRSAACAFLMVALTASAWPLLTTVFTAPDLRQAACVLAAAFLLAVAAAFGRFARQPFDLRYLILLPLLLPAVWVFPWPLSLAAMVLCAALLLGILPRFFPRWKTPLVALVLLGVVLLLQGLALGPALDAMSRWHSVPFLSAAISAVLNFLGAPAASTGDWITLTTVRDAWRFPVSTELLGFPSALLALLGAAVVLVALVDPGRRLRTAVLLLVTWLLYVPLRAVLILLVFLQLQLYVDYFSETVRVDVLWNPWWNLAGWVPLAMIWTLVSRAKARPTEPQPALAACRPIAHSAGFLAAALGTALLILALCHHDVGSPNARRVVVDERYSGWEKSTRAPGTAWYGSLSMYNMFSLSDYLDYAYELTRNTEPLTPKRLADADVLILKTPTKPYPAEEIDAVVDFVRKGGGLYLIGEHTNYVGSAVYLNSVAGRMGLHLREDCVFNLVAQEPYDELWERSRLLFHPIVAHIPRFRFEVSCSVTSDSPCTESVMLGNGLYQLYADYFMENYYPYPRRTTAVHFGPFMQFAARDFGKGRVAVFTDSTTISNFSAFYPGRVEMTLAAVDWLGRSHSGPAWRWVVGSLGALLVLAAAVFLTRAGDRVATLLLLAAALSFGCAVALAYERASVERNFPLPAPRARPVHVAFLREHCDYVLPVSDFVRDVAKSYDLFYQWVLRVRYFPRVRERIPDALDDDCLVIVNPAETFSAEDVGRIRGFIDRGGSVLVLLRGATRAVPVKSLLDPFELAVAWPAGAPSGEMGPVVTGGKPLPLAEGYPPAVVKEIGRGKLVVVGFGDSFSDPGMGFTNTTLPDASLLTRFQLEYKLLRFLVPPERLPEKVRREVEADTAWMK